MASCCAILVTSVQSSVFLSDRREVRHLFKAGDLSVRLSVNPCVGERWMAGGRRICWRRRYVNIVKFASEFFFCFKATTGILRASLNELVSVDPLILSTRRRFFLAAFNPKLSISQTLFFFFYRLIKQPATEQRQDWMDGQVTRLIKADYLDPYVSSDSYFLLYKEVNSHHPLNSPAEREEVAGGRAGGRAVVVVRWQRNCLFFLTPSEMKSNKWRKEQHRWGSQPCEISSCEIGAHLARSQRFRWGRKEKRNPIMWWRK